MSRSVNKAMLIGHVGSPPEIRTTASGTMVAKVSLATNDYAGKDESGEPQEKVNWHRLTFFGRLAEIVEEYVGKGDRIYAEGRIDYSKTLDPEGDTRYWTDIIADELVMLGSLDEKRGAVPADQASDERVPF